MPDRSDTRARALVRQLRADGDPRAADFRGPGRPGATPEQRAVDQALVLGALRRLGTTQTELARRCGLSRTMVGSVAGGTRALSPESRARVVAAQNGGGSVVLHHEGLVEPLRSLVIDWVKRLVPPTATPSMVRLDYAVGQHVVSVQIQGERASCWVFAPDTINPPFATDTHERTERRVVRAILHLRDHSELPTLDAFLAMGKA